ncbi:MAG: O-antigen ligase family protein [Campylobacterota bacterium]|nr:O-antigen ligase family protein [Campylobacterota bacterium]
MTIFFYLFLYLLFLDDINSLFSGLNMLIRFSAILLFYLFFIDFVKKENLKYLFNIANFSFSFLVLNIFLGTLGFGYGMYGGDSENAIGTRGFIFAGNEIGGAILTSGAIIMFKLIEEDSYLKFFIFGIVLIAMGGLLASKVSILGAIILFFFFPLLKAFKNFKNFKIPKKDFIYANLMLLSVPIISAYGIYYVLYESNLINRLSYFYEKLDFVTFIFSSRNIWAEEAINVFSNTYSIINIFFGTGVEWFKYISGNKLVEIDPIDFLMNYGVIGFSIVFGTIFYIIFTVIKNNNPYSIYITFTIFLLLAISSMGGHILASGTSGFLIALLMALGKYDVRKDKI